MLEVGDGGGESELMEEVGGVNSRLEIWLEEGTWGEGGMAVNVYGEMEGARRRRKDRGSWMRGSHQGHESAKAMFPIPPATAHRALEVV